jgi:hypothetical protein
MEETLVVGFPKHRIQDLHYSNEQQRGEKVSLLETPRMTASEPFNSGLVLADIRSPDIQLDHQVGKPK